MGLLLIPCYWLMAFSVFVFVLGSPIKPDSPLDLTFFGMSCLALAAVASAESYLWWCRELPLYQHVRDEWRSCVLRCGAGAVCGVVLGCFSLFVSFFQAQGGIALLLTVLLGVVGGAIFVWWQTHRYVERVKHE